jgi:hypothetical protein
MPPAVAAAADVVRGRAAAPGLPTKAGAGCAPLPPPLLAPGATRLLLVLCRPRGGVDSARLRGGRLLLPLALLVCCPGAGRPPLPPEPAKGRCLLLVLVPLAVTPTVGGMWRARCWGVASHVRPPLLPPPAAAAVALAGELMLRRSLLTCGVGQWRRVAASGDRDVIIGAREGAGVVMVSPCHFSTSQPAHAYGQQCTSPAQVAHCHPPQLTAAQGPGRTSLPAASGWPALKLAHGFYYYRCCHQCCWGWPRCPVGVGVLDEGSPPAGRRRCCCGPLPQLPAVLRGGLQLPWRGPWRHHLGQHHHHHQQ